MTRDNFINLIWLLASLGIRLSRPRFLKQGFCSNQINWITPFKLYQSIALINEIDVDQKQMFLNLLECFLKQRKKG